jgi:transcriptional regulator with XRE-family HTH domain
VVGVRKPHTYSPQTLEAVRVLGLEIARARRARRWTQEELAERAGISANTLRSIERGSPTTTIGVVFELASLLGIDLFGAAAEDLPALVAQGRDRLALLPTRVRTRPAELQDDF